MSKDIIVVGSGLAGMACASYLAKNNHSVTVIEKNSTYGGRLQSISKNGYTFDSGPSWYWMPDIFDSFFADFGKSTSDFYDLKRINPGYRVYFGDDDTFDLEEDLILLKNRLDDLEEGAGDSLQKYLDDAKEKYNVAVQKFMYKPSLSPLEYIKSDLIKRIGRLNLFRPISKHIRDHFSDPKIIQMLEFPSLLLGAKPSDTPSFYSFMNYADFGLGTFHPKKGMYQVILAMEKLAKEQGVKFNTNSNVDSICVENGTVNGIVVNGKKQICDFVLSGADYHHTESLLEKKYRQYSENYWQKKIFAPPSLLFYVGFDKKLKNVDHHTLFFDVDFDKHAETIYDNPQWPCPKNLILFLP